MKVYIIFDNDGDDVTVRAVTFSQDLAHKLTHSFMSVYNDLYISECNTIDEPLINHKDCDDGRSPTDTDQST